MEKDKNKLIQFEDLFKEEIERKHKKIDTPVLKQQFWAAIFSYLMIMFIFSGVIGLWIISSGFTKTYSEEERLFLALKRDQGALVRVDQDLLNQYETLYEPYIRNLGVYENTVVLVNRTNPYVDTYLMVMDDESQLMILNIEILEFLYLKETGAIFWEDSFLPINRYTTSSSTDHPYLIVLEGSRTELSPYGLALSNFMVYLVLLPLVWFFLRKPIKSDWLDFTSKLKSYGLAVVMGYLYILGGNIVSNVLSSMLSKVFRIEPSTAINQLVIIDALKSNGAIYMFVGAVILGPIVEELIFRKALFGLIKNDKTALIVSSIIFGLVHLTNETSIATALVNGIAYIIMGFVFGYIYLKSNKNVVVVTLVHILSNLISVIAVMIGF